MSQGSAPEVTTTRGRLRGVMQEGLAVFRGVPYAAAPEGPRRFRAPEPAEAWEGVRDATTLGAAAPQPPRQGVASIFAGAFSAGDLPVSEDCLNLNVWTPGLDDARRPVMVWVHGGGFRTGTGASPMYDGATLARRGDVVVVTFNYRLGPVGFLYAEELGGANFGLLDQVAALQWVQDEVRAFGGDPDNVTIFGESAGGKSVETLLGTPAARGLFHRAIVQSSHDPPMGVEQATGATSQFLAEVGLTQPDAERLRAMPLNDLIAAQVRLAEAAMAAGAGGVLGAGASFGPVVDGDVLPAHPREATAAGSAADVTLLIGTNLDESRLFGAAAPGMADMDRPAALARIAATLTAGDEARAAATYEAYRAAREQRGDRHAPVDVWFAVQTDRTFRYPSILVAEGQAQHQPATYMYLFTQPSPLYEGVLGSCHALEIPFVFGTNRGELLPLTGKGDAVEALATAMQDAWIAFARTGDPNHGGLPLWPAFTDRRRATMVLGSQQDVAYGPLEAERQAMAEVFPPLR
ncbi:MAG: carboxylesterase/lipase family protein [Dehalococcoidia bacterium]|nr:carboxylesterase/lipase family protein [Dehalococcoidia bacterium]